MNKETAQKILDEMKDLLGDKIELTVEESSDQAKIIISNINLNRAEIEKLMDFLLKKKLKINYMEETIEVS